MSGVSGPLFGLPTAGQAPVAPTMGGIIRHEPGREGRRLLKTNQALFLGMGIGPGLRIRPNILNP